MKLITDENQLIEAIAHDDPVSFKIIYRLHWQKLFNIAFHIMEDEADAEDVVQDVFSSLWHRRGQLQIHTALENYLVRAVKYTAFFHLKVQSERRNALVAAERTTNSVKTAEELLFRKELEEMVNNLLTTLPVKTRQIFSLSRFEGLSYPEIASEMGISVKTVEYHISKALRRFSGKRNAFNQNFS